MPSFPKTETGQARRAAFLAQRRKEYAEGVKLGMTRRDAGHLYSERQAAPKLLEQSFRKPSVPQRKGGTQYPETYVLRNTAADYMKAEVYVRNALTGERRREPLHWTFTSRRGPLTAGDMLRAVQTQLQRKAENYQNDVLEVTRIKYEEEIIYESPPVKAPGED